MLEWINIWIGFLFDYYYKWNDDNHDDDDDDDALQLQNKHIDSHLYYICIYIYAFICTLKLKI